MAPGVGGDCEKCRPPVSDAGEIIRYLRRVGHEVTRSREAVVDAVAAQARPFTAGQLCAAVAELAPSVGRATVFRTLELLEEEHVLDRVHSLRGDAGYVVRTPERWGKGRQARPHQYLVCAACEGVTEVADPRIAALLQLVAQQRGFRLDGQLVELSGRCPSC